MYAFQMPLLCLVVYNILSVGPRLSVDGSNIKEKISRVARDACNGNCEGDNFETHAYHCDQSVKECCRVCEKGQYKSGSCVHHKDHGEYEYKCSNCEEGLYQKDRNVLTSCKICSAPSITCSPDQKIHCNRETGEHVCQDIPTPTEEITTVPAELSTATPGEAGNGTEAAPEKTAQKVSTGGIVGIIIAVILLLVLIPVLVYCCKRGGYRQIEERDEAATANNVSYTPVEANDEVEPAITNDVSHSPRKANDEVEPAITNDVPHSPGKANANEMQAAGVRDANSQQGDEGEQTVQQGDEDGQSSQHIDVHQEEAVTVDDSCDYTLKDGSTFNDFKLEVANQLPPKTRNTFYARLGLERCEYERAEGDEHGNLLDKIYAVLDMWFEKNGGPHEARVQELLSVMWKHNLKETRRLVIDKCCERNGVKADL
ncbi:uncharacterized protein LOC117114232 isoform X2 [Anneissia japonica]|uniref:uncharacterized protein LOC117114232 isoform X2 n=1 Tax=Anneissia japonica TaxID=1529436 RepID=UPI00142553A5|nr:uncharacterized protein LOC117114232 isoform X2 [Anneissia japonica]